MKKAHSERTHGKSMKAAADRAGLSPETVRANKCRRSAERNLKRIAIKRQEADERNEAWKSLSYDEQLKILRARPGKSAKQTEKIRTRSSIG